MFLNLFQQLLIYIRDKKGVRKSKVVNAIQISFTLFNRKTKLVISVSINFVANGISGNTVYITFTINSRVEKNY